MEQKVAFKYTGSKDHTLHEGVGDLVGFEVHKNAETDEIVGMRVLIAELDKQTLHVVDASECWPVPSEAKLH